MVTRKVTKYVVDKKYAKELSDNIKKVAELDKYAPEGSYVVRSLYFDDPHDTALKNREKDTNGREKFRIRFYNGDTDFVRVEKKVKHEGIGTKTEAQLTKEEVNKILNDDFDWMADREEPLIKEFYDKIINQGLRPNIIIEYLREPFVGPNELRITLDHNVKLSYNNEDFLDREFPGEQLNDEISILEIKWAGDFPEKLNEVLELDKFRNKDVSKYVISRKNIKDL